MTKKFIGKEGSIKTKRKNYKIDPSIFLVKDEASVKYHLENDDYFGTIATIISLIKQSLRDKKNGKVSDEDIVETLNNLEGDLVFLQENYEIRPKFGLEEAKNEKKKNNTKRKT